MKPEIRARLIYALEHESHLYQKGRIYLRRKDGEEDCFCVMGVLCDLYIREGDSGLEWIGEEDGISCNTWMHSLPPVVAQWAGLEFGGGVLDGLARCRYVLPDCSAGDLVKVNDNAITWAPVLRILKSDAVLLGE